MVKGLSTTAALQSGQPIYDIRAKNVLFSMLGTSHGMKQLAALMNV